MLICCKSSITRVFLMVILVLLTISPRTVDAATASDTDQAWVKARAFCSGHPESINSFYSPWMCAVALGSQADPLAGSVNLTEPDTAQPASIANSMIGLMAKGENPTQVQINGSDTNLVALLVSKQDVNSGCFTTSADSLNNTIWSVIALDMYNCNYAAAPANYNVTAAIEYIKAKQRASGAYCEWVNDPNSPGAADDIDSTAHALLALAGHTPIESDVVQRALAFLKKDDLQSATGALLSWGSDSPDSTAAVIEALTAWGISPQSADWTKAGKSLVDGLLSHQQSDGSFIEQGLNSTGSALCALADLTAGYSKYRSKLPQAWIRINAPMVLSSGQDCDLTITICNPTAAAQDNLVIAALYDPQGKMLTYSYSQYNLAAGEDHNVGLGFGVNAAAGSLVKVMVWDNWQQRTPLCAPAVIPVH
ncbi:MAG: prenyltransferase/squalene oxidase repeat-containing protein [Methylocystaceae bacterium]